MCDFLSCAVYFDNEHSKIKSKLYYASPYFKLGVVTNTL